MREPGTIGIIPLQTVASRFFFFYIPNLSNVQMD